MDVQRVLGEANDAMNVRRVFGEAYEKDGFTVIPVAKVAGGGGGGSGTAPTGGGTGGGVGFGLRARPVGVYVIKDGDVLWRPAVDVTRIALGAQLVAIVALLVIRGIVRTLATRD